MFWFTVSNAELRNTPPSGLLKRPRLRSVNSGPCCHVVVVTEPALSLALAQPWSLEPSSWGPWPRDRGVVEGLLLLRRCPPAPDPAPGQSPEQGAARLALRMPPPWVPAPIPAEAPLHPAPPSHHRSLQNPALSVSPVDLTTLDSLAVGTRGRAWHSVRGDGFRRQLFPSHPASPCPGHRRPLAPARAPGGAAGVLRVPGSAVNAASAGALTLLLTTPPSTQGLWPSEGRAWASAHRRVPEGVL